MSTQPPIKASGLIMKQAAVRPGRRRKRSSFAVSMLLALSSILLITSTAAEASPKNNLISKSYLVEVEFASMYLFFDDCEWLGYNCLQAEVYGSLYAGAAYRGGPLTAWGGATHRNLSLWDRASCLTDWTGSANCDKRVFSEATNKFASTKLCESDTYSSCTQGEYGTGNNKVVLLVSANDRVRIGAHVRDQDDTNGDDDFCRKYMDLSFTAEKLAGLDTNVQLTYAGEAICGINLRIRTLREA